MSAIPLADAPFFAPAAQRTLIVRVVFAALLAAAIVAAALVARNPNAQTIVSLPSDSTAIVALDLSASISSDTYSRIGSTLSSLARSHGRFGLVVFSDQAYEALPTGTPAADLSPLVRFFQLPKQTTPGFAPTYPKNPWQDAFSSGTKISAGLALAHRIAVDNGVRKPVVILVSDLEDDPDDILRLATVMLAYKRDHVPLRVVSLNPTPEAVAYFQHILPPQTPIVRAGALAPGPQPRNHTPFPWPLVALAALAAVGLALNELWGPRLEWATA